MVFRVTQLELVANFQRFRLHRGIREGSSPSPFAIFIECLPAAVWQNGNIEGVNISTSNYIDTNKISIYADDILLFLQNIHSSMSETMSSLPRVSDYSLNWTKSIVLALNCIFK